MTVESYACQSLSNNNYQQIHMAMNKLPIQQNGHSNMNENRTDDDYGGGGGENKNNLQISSKNGILDNRKSRSTNYHNRVNIRVDSTRWWLVHFIRRFIIDPKRTLTRSRSVTDATRFLRHIQAHVSTAIKCDSVYEESSINTKKRRNSCFNHNHISDDEHSTCIRIRSQSMPNHSIYSSNYQMLTIKRRSQPIVRSSSVHDLNRHEVFRANELEFGPIIGQGFYGIARKVTLKKTGQIMVMKETKTFDKEAQRIFVKEVQVLKRLKHPNVLNFIGLLLDKDNQMCFLVDYIAGGTLKDIIHDLSIPLTWLQRLRYAKDIAAGMEYLHLCNTIHRDLNSSNCLVKSDGHVVVADFGLSRINLEDGDDDITTQINDGSSINFRREQRSTSTTITSNGNIVVVRPKTRRQLLRDRQRYTVVGSPYWMAPEMLKGQCYDERVDIFSFGIMLCEIIGRVQADPDYLPRTQDFGLNVHLFNQKYCSKDSPKQFIAIAIACCDINPDSRPAFCVSHPWLEALALSVETGKFANDNNIFDGDEILKKRNEELKEFIDEHNLLWSIKLRSDSLYVELPQQLNDGSKEMFVSLLEFADDVLRCKHVIVCFNKTRSDRAALVKTFMFLGFHVLSLDNTLMASNDKQEDQLYMVYIIDSDG
ncbi:unnamed protein product [Rotaria sordida]|uniref:Protein kinase domain-containing protein n=1 Tax=Rotaria sordida TaxID=392033 RepID=A0A819LMF7_9BILA|nr:unnamed protein product [Rotaria sordida]